jgi:hypothetical protein
MARAFSGFLVCFCLLGLGLLLASCASGGSGTNPDGTPKDEQSVNTLPWNKPASWEGQSPIPGAGGH